MHKTRSIHLPSDKERATLIFSVYFCSRARRPSGVLSALDSPRSWFGSVEIIKESTAYLHVHHPRDLKAYQ